MSLRTSCAEFLGFSGTPIRIPILALPLILEPVVTLVLWGAALLGVQTSLLFEFSGATLEVGRKRGTVPAGMDGSEPSFDRWPQLKSRPPQS